MVDRIKQLCKQKGMTVASLERICGFGNGSISKWNKHRPAEFKIEAVAKALGTTKQYLLDGETGIKKEPSIPKDEELDKNDAISNLRDNVLYHFPDATPQDVSALMNAIEGTDLTVQELIRIAEMFKRMSPADRKFVTGIFEAYTEAK